MVKHFASQSRLRRPRFSSGCSGQALCFAKPPTASPFLFGVHYCPSQCRKPSLWRTGKGSKTKPLPAQRSDYDRGFPPAKRTAYFIFAALLIAFRRLLYPSNRAAFFWRFHSFSFSHNSFHFRYRGHFSWHFSYRSLQPLQLTSDLVKIIPPNQAHKFFPAVGFLKFSLTLFFQP